MQTVDEARRESSADGTVRSLLIDTDVHEYLPNNKTLVPYLDARWQQWGSAVTLPVLGTAYLIKGGPEGSGRRLEWLLGGQEAGSDLRALQQHLFVDEGVSHAILNGFFHIAAVEGNVEYATALASAYNDWQIEYWLSEDPRIFGSIHVHAPDPVGAAREVDRLGDHPQMAQVFLPLLTNRQFGDPFYRPIFEAAVRNDLPVTMHHGGHTETVVGFPRNFVEWHLLAAPQAAAGQLSSIICNGIFDSYPQLKVVILESGVAWLPWFVWRLDQQYKEMRREIPWVKRLPSEHIRDNVRLSTQPMADITGAQFAKLVELAQLEDVFMFSTDYPHYDADSADAVLPTSLPAELREKIRYGNALATFERIRKSL